MRILVIASLLLTFSSIALAGKKLKEIKGTVISYDKETMTLVAGKKKYLLSNKKLQYNKNVSKCNQLFYVDDKEILKVSKYLRKKKPVCSKKGKTSAR